MEGAIDQVLGVLGAAVPRDAVQRLLDDADGSVETALAMYFDGNDRSAVSTARQGEPLSKEEQLKAVLACDLTPAQLRGLLREAGGSVDAAVDLYFSRPQAPRSASPDVVVLGGCLRQMLATLVDSSCLPRVHVQHPMHHAYVLDGRASRHLGLPVHARISLAPASHAPACPNVGLWPCRRGRWSQQRRHPAQRLRQQPRSARPPTPPPQPPRRARRRTQQGTRRQTGSTAFVAEVKPTCSTAHFAEIKPTSHLRRGSLREQTRRQQGRQQRQGRQRGTLQPQQPNCRQ